MLIRTGVQSSEGSAKILNYSLTELEMLRKGRIVRGVSLPIVRTKGRLTPGRTMPSCFENIPLF